MKSFKSWPESLLIPSRLGFASANLGSGDLAGGASSLGIHRRRLGWQVAALFGFLLLCFASAGLGATMTSSSVTTWYQTLTKPTWNPPDWIFGPVWSVLYLMIAVAGWLVWRKGPAENVLRVWTPYLAQLALNTAWSGIFFGLRQPGWAFVEVLLLWLSIVATMVVFAPRSKVAAFLFAPYLAWVSFAAFLNLTIWRLNS
jgi:translocator protein